MLGKSSEISDLEVETHTRMNVHEIVMLEADEPNKNSRTWTTKQTMQDQVHRTFRAQLKGYRIRRRVKGPG
jgi:hypothetical protein